ncbi:MAG: D-alanyl-D-alanine carboxypeptidase [Oscillospiraceae bacterium]|nr:D-alanyl-D-alanine carboxypeptidase [Oscillospiraceae bacterium]
MKRYTAAFFIWILVLFLPFQASAAYATEVPATASQTSVVMDAATGQVLVEKGMDQKMYPASITKIMTALLALENADPSTVHTMSYEATHSIAADSTHIALTEGEEITLEDLLYATMVASANDAANGIAECIGGTIDQFVVMMNEKAKEIGAVNTHFVNANGLHDENHYTTAYDMALITQYALGVEGFRKYWCAEEYTIQPTNKQSSPRNLGTQHSMFVESQYTFEGCTGGKLGYTDEARHTSVTTAKRGDVELICVTMNSQKYEKYEDAAALFHYCFDSFDRVTLSKQNLKGFVIPVLDGDTQVQEVRIYPDNSISLELHRQYSVSDLNLDYQVPATYAYGEDITPMLKVSLKTESSCMYQDLGSFPLQFSISDMAGQKVDAATGLPVKDNSIFWKNLLNILKWIGIILLVLVVLFFLLVVSVRVRHFLYRKKRKNRRVKYPVTAGTQIAQPRGPVHIYVQSGAEEQGRPRTRRADSSSGKKRR